MQNTVKQMIRSFTKQRTQRRRAYAAFTTLAILVSITTMYSLSQPASTMTGEPICGQQEHIHTDACYTEKLICGLEERTEAVEGAEEHVHDESCYEPHEVLVCTEEAAEAHSHDESCYGLVCGETEYPAHTHGDDCYAVVTETCGQEAHEAHSHDDSCYTTTRSLTCGEAESAGHTHDDSCYDENGALTCGQSESAGHTHSDSCYTESTALTCGQSESAGHTHDDHCFIERVELTCTAQEGPGHVHDDSCYGLACGQEETEGHTHTEECYETRDELVCAAGHVHTADCYEKVLTCQLPEHVHSSACYDQTQPEAPDEPEYICGLPAHAHDDACLDEEGNLICGLEEHEHTEDCLASEAADLMIVLPEGAEVPESYDAEYEFIDAENRFGVKVFAPEGALPEGAVLVAELLEEDSDAYLAAGEALEAMTVSDETSAEDEIQPEESDAAELEAEEPQTEPAVAPEDEEPQIEFAAESEDEEPAEADGLSYDGFVALDIHFELDGEEVEPGEPVYVVINALGLLPENADPESVAVQHHAEITESALFGLRKTTETVVETVADSTEETGQVEAVNGSTGNTLDVAAAFEVESFSTFTVTWLDSYKLILHYVDTDGNSILEGDSETALATYSKLESVTLSQYANRISHSGYAYTSAYVLLNGEKTTAVQVRYNKDAHKWQYAATNDDWKDWMGGTNYTADVYLSYTAVVGNTIVPPENNVYPVDAINVCDENANVILLYPKLKSSDKDIAYDHIININSFFSGTDFPYSDWNVYRIENRGGRYQVIQEGPANRNVGVQVNDAYLLLVKKTYAEQFGLYDPSAEWPTPPENTALDGNGDTVQINLQCNNTEEIMSDGTPLAYLTFSPKNNTATADARADDVAAVADSAIKFQLFDYSTKINRPNGSGDTGWRSITPYFQFRGQQETNGNLQNGNIDNRYDEDGFTVNHATVERTLTNNYPVLDPNRNALGGAKSPTVTETDLPWSERSLAYLFRSGDGAVTAYNPSNTILQKSGTHYYYNSAYNAVDYDIDNSVFRVRDYVERNSSTSTYGDAQKYYDFLPFNYTGGQVVGTSLADARTYNLASADVDYWFGMRMDVDFYQGKGGTLNDEDMVFHFSGDDDVWVFIDDVLVLDLGGTHGTVTGSINFATGEIQQYLDWNGTVGTEGKTSFPTTIKACYEAARKDPNGGWNGDIFADYTKHKLSFFYMERGCAVANCAIDFNLPTLPDKSLQVAKTLTAADGADADVVKHLENTMEYKFRVVKADAGGNPTDQLLIKEGNTYTLSGAGLTANETRTVGADGYFTLKAGQVAEFTNMLTRFDENDSVKKYVVQEVLPTGLTGQYQEVVYSVGSDTGTCTNDTTTVATDFTGYNSPAQAADIGNLVNYTNKVNTEKLSTLAITKTQVGSSLNGPQTYYMKVLLGPDANSLSPVAAGTPYFVGNVTRYVKTEGIISLSAGETAKVKLLAGTYYKVEEVGDGNGTPLTGSEGYTPAYSDNASGTVTVVGTTVNITVTNTFPTGDLELSKTVSNTAGGSTDGEFAFELKFPVGESWTATDYTAAYTTTNSGQTHTGNTLSFEKQDGYAVATVKLYHGEKVAITGLPASAQVSITETNADGYAVSWQVDGQDRLYGNSVCVIVTNGTTVSAACTNTTGAELPQTGGMGTQTFTFLGMMMMLSAGVLLMIQRRRREGI